MTKATQGLLLGLVGAICIRLSISGGYLHYVNSWMRWPLLVTGLALCLLGIRLFWDSTAGAPERGPHSAWLLALPVLAVLVIRPPALGAYAAERSAITVADQQDHAALGTQKTISMRVGEFQSRAQWDETLTGRTVQLKGFVSYDSDGNWYVTTLSMSCCAADAVASRVQVRTDEVRRPPADTWFRVTGRWVDPGTKDVPRIEPPIIEASQVTEVAQPKNPYE